MITVRLNLSRRMKSPANAVVLPDFLRRSRLVFLCLILALAACDAGSQGTPPPEAMTGRISGSVLYRERMMLPPQALVEVQLQDISQADALASVLATVQLTPQGGPPYSFEIDYDPGSIDPRRRYALRATIAVGDTLMFTSTDYIDPFSGGEVEILVRRVAEPVRSSSENSSSPADGSDSWP